MKHRVLSEGPERSLLLVLEEGEEAMACLRRFAAAEGISAARLSAIGAFSTTIVGFFDRHQRGYRRIEVSEQAEVLSLLGDVAQAPGGEPMIHVHAVLGLQDGSTRGGHLLVATVSPTLELMLVESPAHLKRRYVPDLGIALIDTGEHP